MKHSIYLLFLAFAFLACGRKEGQPGTAAPAQPLNLTEFQLTDIPGSAMQRAIRTDSTGKIAEEGMVLDGKRQGEWVLYSTERDVPRSIANYADDKLNGPYMEFAPFGQVNLICSYIDNQLEGRFVRLMNIRPFETGTYLHGQLEGLYTKYYESRDIVQQEQMFKQGKLHGTTKFFNEKGDLIMQYEYKDGEKVSGGVVEPTTASTAETKN